MPRWNVEGWMNQRCEKSSLGRIGVDLTVGQTGLTRSTKVQNNSNHLDRTEAKSNHEKHKNTRKCRSFFVCFRVFRGSPQAGFNVVDVVPSSTFVGRVRIVRPTTMRCRRVSIG